jgi:hypothetical protein
MMGREMGEDRPLLVLLGEKCTVVCVSDIKCTLSGDDWFVSCSHMHALAIFQRRKTYVEVSLITGHSSCH